MTKQLKRGLIADLKIKSTVSLIIILISSTLLSACSDKMVIYPSELTATAWAVQDAIQNSPTPGQAIEPATQTPTPEPTEIVRTASEPAPTQEVDPALALATPTVGFTGQALPISPTTASTPIPTRTLPPVAEGSTPFIYYSQSGDTLPALAYRFSVDANEIKSTTPLPVAKMINPGLLLIIPNRVGDHGPIEPVFPDAEVVYSATSIDFDIDAYVAESGGYLSKYREYYNGKWMNGADVIRKFAQEYSINPRLLLAILEYKSHWVFGNPGNKAQSDYPMGWNNLDTKGILAQLGWASRTINIAYYHWREGKLNSVKFPSGKTLRLAPNLNSGSVTLQYFFSIITPEAEWETAIYSDQGIIAKYEEMFGSPWARAQKVEPLLPTDLTQPDFALPYPEGATWNYTGGPHAPWSEVGSWAALDFAPHAEASGCVEARESVTSISPGLVVRDGNAFIVVDMDGDGNEQTGWVILYLHLKNSTRVKAGTWLNQDDEVGMPSCEGGLVTGTHVHIARKYNGEWVAAAGPLPFNLSGWVAGEGAKQYQGTLTRGDNVAVACTCSDYKTNVTR